MRGPQLNAIPMRNFRRRRNSETSSPSAPPLLKPPGYERPAVPSLCDYRLTASNPHAELTLAELDVYNRWKSKSPQVDAGELTGIVMNVTRDDGIWHHDRAMRALLLHD